MKWPDARVHWDRFRELLPVTQAVWIFTALIILLTRDLHMDDMYARGIRSMAVILISLWIIKGLVGYGCVLCMRRWASYLILESPPTLMERLSLLSEPRAHEGYVCDGCSTIYCEACHRDLRGFAIAMPECVKCDGTHYKQAFFGSKELIETFRLLQQPKRRMHLSQAETNDRITRHRGYIKALSVAMLFVMAILSFISSTRLYLFSTPFSAEFIFHKTFSTGMFLILSSVFLFSQFILRATIRNMSDISNYLHDHPIDLWGYILFRSRPATILAYMNIAGLVFIYLKSSVLLFPKIEVLGWPILNNALNIITLPLDYAPHTVIILAFIWLCSGSFIYSALDVLSPYGRQMRKSGIIKEFGRAFTVVFEHGPLIYVGMFLGFWILQVAFHVSL